MRRFTTILLFLIATAIAADRDLVGPFAGEWKSASGNGGTIRFTLQAPAAAAWKCDLTFSYSDADVKTTMREVKLQDGKIELVYDFDIQGTALRSRLKGEWDGKSFRGSYLTTLVDGSQEVDNGTWNASRKN